MTTAPRAVLALSTRLLRRGALILTAAGGTYVAVEVISYLQSYPDQASRARLADFQDNPSIRMIQGLAHNVDTVGGFVGAGMAAGSYRPSPPSGRCSPCCGSAVATRKPTGASSSSWHPWRHVGCC